MFLKSNPKMVTGRPYNLFARLVSGDFYTKHYTGPVGMTWLLARAGAVRPREAEVQEDELLRSKKMSLCRSYLFFESLNRLAK